MYKDPVTVRQDVISEGGGAHDIVVVSQHEPPPGTEFTLDDRKDYDLWVANRVMSLLHTVYPGHLWAVQCDVSQGIVKISIPILMGVTRWYVVNLRQTQLTPGAVVAAGGEILERYKLRRGRFELGSFLEARAQHSALVVPSRRVPG